MAEESYNVLDALRDIMETERSFLSMIRFLDGNTRNQIVAAHLRNTNQALGVLRSFMTTPGRTVLTIPINIPMDVSGNPNATFANFFDPVPVVPTQQQIEAAVETHINIPETVCAICQDNVNCATRIRACGHCFHGQCIQEWFTINTRCPVCRHDVRDLRITYRNQINDRGVHSNEE